MQHNPRKSLQSPPPVTFELPSFPLDIWGNTSDEELAQRVNKEKMEETDDPYCISFRSVPRALLKDNVFPRVILYCKKQIDSIFPGLHLKIYGP